eukprot:1840439-Heterocapsa_arctica.AAC.1
MTKKGSTRKQEIRTRLVSKPKGYWTQKKTMNILESEVKRELHSKLRKCTMLVAIRGNNKKRLQNLKGKRKRSFDKIRRKKKIRQRTWRTNNKTVKLGQSGLRTLGQSERRLIKSTQGAMNKMLQMTEAMMAVEQK